MGFRRRLAVFVVVILIAVQAITAGTIFMFTRNSMLQNSETVLARSATAFSRELNTSAQSAATQINELARHSGQRGVYATFLDNLAELRRNLSGADGAAVRLIGADGRIVLDSRQNAGFTGSFPFPDLLVQKEGTPFNAAAVLLDGKLYWSVAVPIADTSPLLWAIAEQPLDDIFLKQVAEHGALLPSIAIAVDDGNGHWHTVAGDGTGSMLVKSLSESTLHLGGQAQTIDLPHGQNLAVAAPLAAVKGSAQAAIVIGTPIATSLLSLRPILMPLLLAAALGVSLALLGALLIAKSIIRPFEALAETARKIEAGDYSPPPTLKQRDEIGQLSAALASMARAVAEREERIKGWSSHDPVTGLLNRTGLAERMAADLSEGISTILLIGLVRLQETVNTVGRDIADRLMQDASTRLAALAEGAPIACVSDHAFVVFLNGCERMAAVDLAGKIVLAFERPYQERHLAIDTTVAAGIALAPEHGTEATLLLRRADVAFMAALKAQNRIAVYDPEADPRRPEHLSLMVDLRQAVDHKELSLHFQPKLDLHTQRITGVEALVRWQHEFRGLVPPDLFIPLAEETGNIQRLTRWALATGIAQAARWLNRGLALRMSINLSVRDLGDRQLPRRVASLLSAHDVPSEYLLLEVTESAIMGEPDTAIAVLHEMADQGIALSIDDFGVGHSSLAYLRRLPVREIKIDKSFVQPLAVDLGSQKIVQSVIELGHRLGYTVTAEGVEDDDALMGLGVLGCDYAQGYYISRPLSREQMERFFTDSKWAPARISVRA